LTKMNRRKRVSIIIPAYNEEGNMPSVIERLGKQEAALSASYDFEFIVLDNCSIDRTREIVLDHCRQNNQWKYLRYSRKFGPRHGRCGDNCIF
jgi:polyisoprenyl-phosphate glycosyltransferase